MNLRLKPCPFCGGAVKLERPVDRPRFSGPNDWWGVVCRNTENLGGSCAVSIAPSRSKEAAVARWNARPSIWVLIRQSLAEALAGLRS